MNFLSTSLGDTQIYAEKFLKELVPSKDGATTVGLYGDLGSGKTTFVQSIGRALGITDPMQSPTFVIIKKFILHTSYFKTLFHVDAYRIEKGGGLLRLGFKEMLSDPKNLILVEWADRVADILPPGHIKLRCRFVDAGTREFGVK